MCGHRLDHKTYLDFDQFLDAVDNEDMLVALWTLADDCFITSAQPPVLESFLICHIVIHIT